MLAGIVLAALSMVGFAPHNKLLHRPPLLQSTFQKLTFCQLRRWWLLRNLLSRQSRLSRYFVRSRPASCSARQPRVWSHNLSFKLRSSKQPMPSAS